MADGDIDLYADDIDHDFNQDGDYNHDSNVDLYDDVITTPSDDHHNDVGRPSSSGGSSPHLSRHAGKRVAVYVGNLTWWTTDQDLTEAIHTLGVNDIIEIKFYENRANGQSKGFCVVALGSENSLQIVMDKLPKKELHGQNPAVTACTRQNLNYFELQSRKGGHGGGGRHDSTERRSRERDRERDRDSRDMRPDSRSMQGDRNRNRNNNSQGFQTQQRLPPGALIGGPPQGPPPPQYQPGRTPWISAPPPQIHQMPPPPARPGGPPVNTGAPPPPPGLQAPPPVRPGPPPPNNMRLPPPRGPMPPLGPRPIPPPDTRGPPPNEWERHLGQPPPQHVGMPPQPLGPPNRMPPPVPAPGQGMPPSIPPSAPMPSPHINPAFFHQQGVPPGIVPSSQGGDLYNRPPPVQFTDYRSAGERGADASAPAISEAEFEEIMGRNRTVSSSAISRAVADASASDYASAIETLVTAISLIKQSKVANDERCKILISSLQDTLHGIESKSYGSRSKERPRSRERERSRERSSRREKSSRRDRSRSRDREYRDRSRERDRYHEDRYRDKDRDHDRDRRSSRH